MEISKVEYEDILRKQAAGQITLYNDPANCRRFFSELDTDKMQELIGEPLKKEKNIINSLLVLEVLSLIVSAVASIFVLGWFSIVAVPVLIILFFILKAGASRGKQSIFYPSLFVFAGFLTAFSNPEQSFWFKTLVISLPVTYLFIKSLYYFSSRFCFTVLHRNFEFFKLVFQKLVWLEVNQ